MKILDSSPRPQDRGLCGRGLDFARSGPDRAHSHHWFETVCETRGKHDKPWFAELVIFVIFGGRGRRFVASEMSQVLKLDGSLTFLTVERDSDCIPFLQRNNLWVFSRHHFVILKFFIGYFRLQNQIQQRKFESLSLENLESDYIGEVFSLKNNFGFYYFVVKLLVSGDFPPLNCVALFSW